MAASSPLLTEAIRALEAGGPLEDAQASRAAARAAASDEDRIAHRAALLAERRGLPEGLARARRMAPWVLLGLALLVTLAGLGLAGTVVDAQQRRINVLAALVALLGAHLLSLAVWLVALLWPGTHGGGSVLGRAWLSITARLALGRGAEAAAVAQGALSLLQRARLLPWLAGLASHIVWAVALFAALGALVFALSFRAYTLGFETTLLDPADFGRAVQALSVVPGWLGFAAPDVDAPSDRALAQWLLGCVLVYGLLPRIVLALLCGGVWLVRAPRLRPDASLPYYHRLAARLEALVPATVIDPDTIAPPAHARHSRADAPLSDAALLVGFELAPEQPWPPAPLPTGIEALPPIDGSQAQRQRLLDTVAQRRPRLLVLALNAAASPDRGTERLLNDLLPLAGECRLWLLAPEDRPGNAQRWLDWMRAAGFGDLVSFTDASALQAANTVDTAP
ncbi:DUF2868 domain-containing protein [Variovorax dokdonensis]|uniref:DUF2868 domain-containing protein n=1 Tax=Variovorax dokdonensis TaxID=344883 RepID=A0ABT7NDC8_9BURK|nr:DUF2868 domain-containing protein [Variovorax dokdonensis]MDM0045956.1 DUF2868 domain-containing protein [Variovorax dokdonensis]